MASLDRAVLATGVPSVGTTGIESLVVSRLTNPFDVRRRGRRHIGGGAEIGSGLRSLFCLFEQEPAFELHDSADLFVRGVDLTRKGLTDRLTQCFECCVESFFQTHRRTDSRTAVLCLFIGSASRPDDGGRGCEHYGGRCTRQVKTRRPASVTGTAFCVHRGPAGRGQDGKRRDATLCRCRIHRGGRYRADRARRFDHSLP